jgi:hypothetical protein
MPATSEKQKKFMDAVAHNPAFAKKVGVPKAVGKDFSEASKGMKFGKGSGNRADAQAINKPKTKQGKSELFKKGGEMKESKAMVKKEVSFMKKKGAPASMVKHEMKEAGMKKMAGGGAITKAKMGAVPSGGNKGKGEHAIQKSGISKGTTVKMSGSKPLGMKNGGMSKGKC